MALKMGGRSEEVANQSNPRELRLHCNLIDALSEVLEWLDHAHTAQTPRAHVSILREISSKLLGESEILVTPTIESNYRILNEIPWLVALTQGLSASRQDEILSQLPDALFRVWFPRVERENILNHALLGHEMGHPVADDFFEDYEQRSEYQEGFSRAQEIIAKDPLVAAQLNACVDETERSQFKTELSQTIETIHKRAMVEIMSDAVAAFIFGPSALLSLMDFFIREPLDALPVHDEYYPPTRYRWRKMLQIMRHEGYLEELEGLVNTNDQGTYRALGSTLEYLNSAAEETSDLAAIERNAYTRTAYSWLEETLVKAVPYARQRSNELKYDKRLISAQVPSLVERLSAHVPPSEIGVWPHVRSVDWRSALCASWVIALTQSLDAAKPAVEKRKLISRVHNLALKAVDYIFLQRELADFRSRKP